VATVAAEDGAGAGACAAALGGSGAFFGAGSLSIAAEFAASA